MQAPNQEAMCFQNRYGEWEERHRCKVITSTRGTFMDMFDDDDTLMYEPAQTAAIILTGDDEEAEKAALEVIRRCMRQKMCHMTDRDGIVSLVVKLVSRVRQLWTP